MYKSVYISNKGNASEVNLIFKKNQQYVNQAITITGGGHNIYDIQIKNNA